MTEAMSLTTCAEFSSDCRGNVVLANASLSQNDDRTLERVKSQHLLEVHWPWSETVTVQAPLRFTRMMQMDNLCEV